MNIGIVGGTSFLGTHLIKNLSSLKNCTLHIWSRNNINKNINSTYYKYNYPIKPLNVKDVQICDYIFFCVGVGVQPGQSFSTNELYQLNLFEPINLINSLIEVKYAGTIFTFGSYFEIGVNKEQINFSEKLIRTITNAPLNEYGITKKILTEFVNQRIKSNKTIKLAHFILPNIYGESENKNRLIPYLVKQLKLGVPIKVGSGTQIRQFLYVNDITHFFKNIIKSKINVKGIYNLHGPESKNIKEIITEVIKFGKQHNLPLVKVNYNKVNKSDSTADYLGLDGKKANFELGWNPSTKLEDVIPNYFNESNIQ